MRPRKLAFRDINSVSERKIMRAKVIPASFVRRTAEVITSPFVFTRRLPPEAGGGVICVSTRVGGLKYLFKSSDRLDKELLEIAKFLVKPGYVVWDVGANVGLFSRAAAFYAGYLGSVLSIEADMEAVKLLLKTSRLTRSKESVMTVLPVAISNEVGYTRFDIARRAGSSNALEGFGSTQTGGIRETRVVPCTTLDNLLAHFPEPKVLKIDVEGAESLVLSGAANILRRIRPRIYCEVSGFEKQNVYDFLRDFGYTLWDGQAFDWAHPKSVSSNTCNIVALP